MRSPVEAVPPDAMPHDRADTESRRDRRAPASWRWNAVSNTATCGTSGPTLAGGRDALQVCGIVQRREIDIPRSAGSPQASISDRPLKPLAAVHDSMTDRVDARRRDGFDGSSASAEPAHWSSSSSAARWSRIGCARTTSARYRPHAAPRAAPRCRSFDQFRYASLLSVFPAIPRGRSR